MSYDNLEEVTLRVGMGLRAEWMEARPVSLSGMQMKMGGVLRQVEGEVIALVGDNREHPTVVLVRVRQEDGTEVDVKPAHIVELFDASGKSLVSGRVEHAVLETET